MNERLSEILRKLPQAQAETATVQTEFRAAREAKRREGMPKRCAAAKAWCEANPVLRAQHIARRGVKRRAERTLSRLGVSGADLVEADRICLESLNAPDWRCHYCGKPAPREQRTTDHVTALSRGGKHTPSNLRPACRSCNSRKSASSDYVA